MEIILASQSPRRKELLKQLGIEPKILPSNVVENIDEESELEDIVCELARKKARACLEQNENLKQNPVLIIAADTIVALGNQILGKPKDANEAKEFLRLLSGRTHEVLSGFCVLHSQSLDEVLDYEITEVQFRSLSEKEISDYVKTGEPMDKAGAYGIQGPAKDFVIGTKGSWTNVVGLPIEKLKSRMTERGWL